MMVNDMSSLDQYITDISEIELSIPEPKLCEICERDVDEVFGCAGCGEVYGCKSCMYYDPDWMEYFCDVECVREYERKNDANRHNKIQCTKSTSS